jgi:hypothetical protein
MREIDPLIKKLLSFYPTEFKQRFMGEMILTISDMQRDGLPNRNGLAQKIFIIIDLLSGLTQANFDQRRQEMKKNPIVWVIGGIAILALWVFMFTPSLSRLFFNWQMKDSYLLLLGENPARVFVTLLDVVGYLGPLLAFILLLVPVVSIDLQKEEGFTMRLKARQVSVLYRGFIIAATLLSLGWYVILIASRI